MKKLLLLILIMSFTQTIFSQTESINTLVRKVKRANRDAEKLDLTIPGWLVRFGTNFIDDDDLDGVNVKILGRKLSEVRIVTVEGKRNIQSLDIHNFMTDIHKEGFEDLMMIRSEGDDVRLMIREKKDLIRNIVLVVNEKDEGGDFVLLSLEGKFSMEDINKMMADSKITVNRHSLGTKKKTVKSDD